MHRTADPQQALTPGVAPSARVPQVGFGLRVQHYETLLKRGVRADFAEATSENFLGRGGRAFSVLERVRADVPVALHGVSLSVGGMDPLREDYLTELSALATRISALSVSDHLCFGTFGGHYAHDLWPLPYTEEALAHVVTRVQRVQDKLGRQLLLENVSSYVAYRASTLSEWEFLAEVARRADAGILLDLNNVYVSAENHGFSAQTYLHGMPRERVQQIHLAGHTNHGSYLLDDHGSQVSEAVWQLYEQAVALFGPVPTIIEWDERVPELAELEAEAERARVRAQSRPFPATEEAQ
ncbi:MAG TPA: DUF692 domain-containing protein [Polyangiaceae bacterium]